MAAACAVALALGGVGCGNDTLGASEVTGTTWRLQSLHRTDPTVPPAPAVPPGTFTLRFTDEARVEVRADCNSCGGAFQLAGLGLIVHPLACTRAFCTGSAPFDTEYVRIIEGSRQIIRTDDTLTLLAPEGVLLFVR